MTTVKLWTMNEIQDANRTAGYHWFSPGSMRFFRTRIYPEVYQGTGGVYFITSDAAGFRPENGREYNVRSFDPGTSQTGTAQDGKEAAKGFKTKISAVRCACRLAGDNVVVAAAPFVPITDEDQFAFTIDLHGKCGIEVARRNAAVLMRYGAAHNREMCNACNCEWWRGYDDEGEPIGRLKKIRDSITILATQVNAGVIFSGDPRGVTVKLTFADGFTNDFAYEGVIVPGA